MKRAISMFCGSLLVSALPSFAANIAWVSFHPADDTPSANALAAGFTNAPDAGYTRLLAANGHTVTRFVTIEGLQNSPDLIAALNTNDLVIISRSVPSGHYDSAAETAAWNGLTKPLMSLNGYVDRANRLGFHTGDTIPDVNSNPMRLRVNAVAHPMFAGIALTPTNTMVNPYCSIVVFTNASTGATNVQRGISVVTSPIIAGGSVLATVGTPGDAAFGGMVIGEFPPGITSQRGDVLAARRLVFLTGSRELSITSEGAGIFDLSADGAQMFLNAVTYLTTPQLPKCTVPVLGATNLVEGDTWTFTAGPIGDPPLSYQWYKDGQPVADGTTEALTLLNLTSSDAGDYYLVVTNLLGSATSTTGRLEFASFATANLTNRIISYWPLDGILGSKTPDLVSGYDMTLVNMSSANLVPGRWGQAFSFTNGTSTMLQRVNNPADDLPIYKYPNFTVSLWVNGPVQTDHRVFSEGSTTNNNTLFNIGTHSGGTDGSVDIYIRTDGGTVIPGDHRHTTAIAFDDTWHHIAYVQRDVGNGSMIAAVYVDGVRDAVTITPVRPLTPQTTSIGGILRGSPSAWFTGFIDEVAVWDRALSPEEIALLQVTQITNPPSRLQPLAINSFKADLPAVVTGDSTVLRWDVSKDATQVTIDKLGDVTAITQVGIGTNVVTPTGDTTYVLTVRRGVDTLSATTSVAVVSGVAAGWTLLDNFDRYAPGQLAANGYWTEPTGFSAEVINVGANRALRTVAGNSVAFLNLRTLTIPEFQGRTLFYRMMVGSAAALNATNIVGLTDKSQRSYGDNFSNIGPVLYHTAFTNVAWGVETNAWYIGARNYPGSSIDYPFTPLEYDVVYNIWIDITNAPMGDPYYLNDTFSVYIQKEGETERTLLFENYGSDRDLFVVDPVLGPMLPNLDKLIVLGNSATYSAVFDDFYLSKSGYNATVPRPYGSTAQPGSLEIRWNGSQLEIRWSAGILQEADAITGSWSDVTGANPPSYLVTPSGSAKFYRARQ